MAKKKAAKPGTKSEFLHKALTRNPELDIHQINRLWARRGHPGTISSPLYYKVRAELGIKTEWGWVQERKESSNQDLVEAAKDV